LPEQEIAWKACSLVKDGQMIVIDGGATLGWLARKLSSVRRLTIATNSLPAAMLLLEDPDVNVRLAGGHIHTPNRVTLGQEAIDFFRQFHADYCFVGAYRLRADTGLTVANAEEAAVKAL
jgi:DeoR/GlpR family transcriptional regulator of sugar metabolism